jgi:hypothetical protein
MMKAKDFYKLLNKYNDAFSEHGFTKDRNGLYSRPGFKLMVQLNKWGWDDVNGWGFFIRVIDTRYEDEYGIFNWSGTLDITPQTLALDTKTIARLYKDQPQEVIKTFQDGQWISFHDIDHANKVLSRLLPAALEMVAKWVSIQEQTIFTDKRESQKSAKGQKEEIEQELKRIFDD